MRAPCPKLDQVTEDFNKSPFMVQLTKENQELYDYLSNHSGNAVNTLEKVDFLYDVLHIEVIYTGIHDCRSFKEIFRKWLYFVFRRTFTITHCLNGPRRCFPEVKCTT
jgi:hypothetical protein